MQDSSKESRRGRRRMHRNNYRRDAMTAAKELGYGRKVVDQIKRAKSDEEIERIMRTARLKTY